MIEERLATILTEALEAVASSLGLDGPLPVPELERPRRKGFGDFSTNLAMVAASGSGAKPREVAEAIVAAIPEAPFLEKAEVAG
ncbi:MAG TPA: arginine--tRNA ligase, partial [Actinomycetota bacterium]